MSFAANTAGTLLDALGRPLRSLRLSVTDRCNLRCRYCMPEEEYVWLERQEILTFEEIARLARVFMDLGVDRLRLTGGEPLLRRDLPRLVGVLTGAGRQPEESPGRGNGDRPAPPTPRLRDLALTTNGLQLAAQACALREAGLNRITVSLDTLRPDRFRQLTQRDSISQVLDGIRAAREAGFGSIKVNAVVMRGFNDDELADLIDFGRESRAEVRFIEYMDVGGATLWSMEQVVSRREILERLAGQFGAIEPLDVLSGANGDGAAPADRFRLGDGTIFGIIASTTAPFCAHCDRARLTPDGLFLLCLYARHGVDLKSPLRKGASAEEIRALIVESWRARRDRGAEERNGLRARGPLFPAEALRRDPHLEMHTRGG
ncbi:MAG TPA: GTP 3',8-cyclase MoaA [Terriglobia bacterium]